MKNHSNQIVMVKSNIHKKLSKKLIESKKYYTMHREFKGFSMSTDLDLIKSVTNFITFKMFMNDLHSCPVCNTRTGYFTKKLRKIMNESKEILHCADCGDENDLGIEQFIALNNEEKYLKVKSSLNYNDASIETSLVEEMIRRNKNDKSLFVV